MQKPRADEAILKNKVVGLNYIISRYYKTTISKTVWYWQKDRHVDIWTRIESQNKNMHVRATYSTQVSK
jgi:hypothetical protein